MKPPTPKQQTRVEDLWGYDTAMATNLPPDTLVIGVDEVGRGSAVGPVVAGAVCWPVGHLSQPDALTHAPWVDDSKRLSPAKRQQTAQALQTHLPPTHWAIGQASIADIAELNILNASQLAMVRALQTILAKFPPNTPYHVLVDGNLPLRMLARERQQPVVKGDSTSWSIAAAAILAKVYRDDLLTQLAQTHPEFAWEKNAGYLTLTHRTQLKRLGPTPHHRLGFLGKILTSDTVGAIHESPR